jgi:hypothetical protein
MKKSELTALAKQVVPRDWAIKGDLAFMQPVDHTLRGIHFDTSAFRRKVTYVTWFYLPLWLPRTHLTLTLGARIRHSWNIDDPGMVEQLRDHIVREALPILDGLRTPHDVARTLLARVKELGVVLPLQQELAYALARTKDPAAIEAFDTVLTVFNPAVEWQRELAARALSFRDELIRNPDAAMRQLLAWEQVSLSNLGLEKFASSRWAGTSGADTLT